MTTLDPAKLAAAAAELNLSPEALAKALDATATTPSLTVGAHVERLLANMTENSRRTYRTPLERFSRGFGPVCDQDCEPCSDPATEFRCGCDCRRCTSSAITLENIAEAAVGPDVYNRHALETVATVAKRVAQRRGRYENRRRALKGKPPKNADGVGAQETAISAMRKLFQDVPGLVDGYDGLDVAKPHRTSRERRPLLDFELVELHHETATGGNDPKLDTLLLDYGLQTGARRSGAYGLTLGQIRPGTQTIRVRDKYDREHDAPVSAELIDRLITHARIRGGPICDPNSSGYRPDGPVFHYRVRGGGFAPITSRRFGTIHERWQTSLPWAGEEQVAYHHIRHTMAHLLKTHYGPQYAKRYLRHSKGDVTDTYGACTTAELARALAELFEFEHPLVHGIDDRRAETLRRLGRA